MAKRKAVAKTHKTKKQSSSYWLVPAVITVLIGIAIMWCWYRADIKKVEQEEETLRYGTSKVKGASTTSEEIDAMFKKLDQTSTEDLSDLEQ
jgi:bacteriorhodopsin